MDSHLISLEPLLHLPTKIFTDWLLRPVWDFLRDKLIVIGIILIIGLMLVEIGIKPKIRRKIINFLLDLFG